MMRSLAAGRAEPAAASASCGHLLAARSRSLAEADDARNVQRARTHAALVAAAVDLRRELHARIPAAHVQRADALRPVHLVRA